MDEEALNLSIRKFLKMVGVNSQRELEHAVEKGIASGAIAGNETVKVAMILKVAALQVDVKFDGEITLQ